MPTPWCINILLYVILCPHLEQRFSMSTPQNTSAAVVNALEYQCYFMSMPWYINVSFFMSKAWDINTSFSQGLNTVYQCINASVVNASQYLRLFMSTPQYINASTVYVNASVYQRICMSTPWYHLMYCR